MSRFTQTVPGPGLPCELDEDAALAVGAGTGWLGAGELGLGAGVAALALAAGAAAPLAVANGAIFAMTAAEIPAFDKSSTDEYGRAAMIFLAVAGPTPGKVSSSFSLAVFTSTLALLASAFVERAVEPSAVLLFLVVWLASMLDVITPTANTVAMSRNTTALRGTFIRSSGLYIVRLEQFLFPYPGTAQVTELNLAARGMRSNIVCHFP